MNEVLAKYIARLIAQDLGLTSFPKNEIERNLINNNFGEVELIIIPTIFRAYSNKELVYKGSEEE